MNVVINFKILQAYSLCARKAYLLMQTNEEGEIHEYETILERHQLKNQTKNLENLVHKYNDVHLYSVENLNKGYDFLIDAYLSTEKLQIYCPLLKKTGNLSYEPTIFIGTYKINKTDKLKLIFIGHILAEIQGISPKLGHIVNVKGESRQLKLEQSNKILTPILAPLKEWLSQSSIKEVPVTLNKHCSVCQFRETCRTKALQEDSLSLLDKVTPKMVYQYEKKGIFTVKQLSYLFKPRKRKRRTRKPPSIIYKPELQALAIRTGVIYLQELPEVLRHSIEIFLDIESIPDQDFYYLIGMVICQDNETEKYSLWANNNYEEEKIFKEFLAIINQYPNSPIYHYGNFELRALKRLTQKYCPESKDITIRLVNINNHIYGKIYFPVYSNKLKEVGRYIGSNWTSIKASGLQSLVWRYYWDDTKNDEYKNNLLQYNLEDCYALKLLTNKITEIEKFSNTLERVDFADKRKQKLSTYGKEASEQFEKILKFAHFNYDSKKISFQSNEQIKQTERYGPRSGKIKPKPLRTVYVEPKQDCEQCGYDQLKLKKGFSKRLIVDLKLTRSGIRRTITEYIGHNVYCPKCMKSYSPPSLKKYRGNQYYGFGLKAWAVYHRVALKLPYESIVELLEEQFNEKVWFGRIPDFIKQFAKYYQETEKSIFRKMLKNHFIHADETSLNIRGINWYAWVFTDGKNVIFKLRETRESEFLHDLLKEYKGILISDFYSGYDSLDCKQQKCWVHLIRDLNQDLRDSPFDIELEMLVSKIRNVLIPIMEAIKKYGLRKRNLNKFKKNVSEFYEVYITGKFYKSELAITYQKRFLKYQDSLFTFLEHDDVPWHNNTAERAIRPLALQRDRSSPLGETVTNDYLTLLSIQQTCRFQNKSFFKFLFSGEIDLDSFKPKKSKRIRK